MKKLLALVLAAAMCLSLVACGAKKEEAPAEGDKEVEAAEKMRVHFIVSNLGDKSFNDSAHRGLQQAGDELENVEYTYTEIGLAGQGKEEPALLEASEEGYDVIVCNNLAYVIGASWLVEHAGDYPDTTYIIFDEPELESYYVAAEEAINEDAAEGEEVTLERHPNIQAVGFRANESDFLAGAVAAHLSKSGIISFVGGASNNVIGDFLVGYIQGAQHVNPDIKVVVSYTETWGDPAKGKELANAAIDLGADVVHAVAGASGNGALAAAQEAGIYGIGVDSDQYEIFKADQPELAASIVTSALKNVDAALYDIISQMAAGTYTVTDVAWYGMNEGASGLAENENYEALVSEEFRAEVEAMKTNPEIKVSSRYDMSEEEFNAIVDSAKL